MVVVTKEEALPAKVDARPCRLPLMADEWSHYQKRRLNHLLDSIMTLSQFTQSDLLFEPEETG